MFGWEGSKYKDGILFFYPELTGDIDLFPTLSAISDLALLFCSQVRTQYDLGEAQVESISTGIMRITRSRIEQMLFELQAEHGKCWTKEYRSMKSPQLADAVCGHLAQWGFGEWQDSMFFLLYPIGGRYRTQYGEIEIEEWI
jgi:hypothetical protein